MSLNISKMEKCFILYEAQNKVKNLMHTVEREMSDDKFLFMVVRAEIKAFKGRISKPAQEMLNKTRRLMT